MAGMSADEFEAYIIAICSKSPVVKIMATINLSLTWLKVRVYLMDNSFIDVSYNHETGKTTFAQIRDDQRIFGADNKKRWHWHPRADPDSHVPVEAEITFEEFVRALE